MLPYLLTLGATLSFSSASLIFATFSRRVSVLWMNTIKALVALALLCLTLPPLLAVTVGWSAWQPPSSAALLTFLVSGALGLGIGDLFLLDAFIRLGVARTLLLYGFQPIFLGIMGAVLFQQPFSFGSYRLLAIAFLIGCLVIFTLERYRETRSWEFRGLIMAIIGVSMDSTGVVLTRFAFEHSPHTQPLEGHFVRCVGALLSYVGVVAYFQLRRRLSGSADRTPIIGIALHFQRLDPRSRILLVLGCFGGTYLSLCLYLTAIQIGHLASISAISITGPMFAAALEAIVQRRRPSRYLLAAFACFVCGFSLLLVSS